MSKSTLFHFLVAAIVVATLCAIKCGTAVLATSSVPCIAMFAAVVNMAFVAYRARSDPIISTISDPPCLPVSSHCKTSALVYNQNDAGKRAVISAYCLRVNCFNLSNASNT